MLQTWCFSLPGSSSALQLLRLLLRHSLTSEVEAKVEGSIRKKGDTLQVKAAAMSCSVEVCSPCQWKGWNRGTAKTQRWDGCFCKRLGRV